MSDIKIMFWNIHNVDEYKTIEPEEYELEKMRAPEKTANKKSTLKQHKLQSKMRNSQRESIVSIISANDVDAIALVEFYVSKPDLTNNGVVQGSSNSSFSRSTPSKQADTDKDSAANNQLIFHDHFGPEQFLVSLNDRQSARWQVIKSAINTTNILQHSGSESLQSVKSHKNSIFEFYAILWRTDKLKVLNADNQPATLGQTTQMVRVDKSATGHFQLYNERFPFYSSFCDAANTSKRFSIMVNHSVFGRKNGLSLRKDTIKKIASSSIVSQLRDAKPNEEKHESLIICGDFNLDYSDYHEDYQLIVNEGMTACIKDKKSSTVKSSRNDLKQAYDQIFTRGFIDNNKQGDIFNFAEEYLNGNYEHAAKISDHLPAVVTITL